MPNDCELEDKNFVPWIKELTLLHIGFLCLKLFEHFYDFNMPEKKFPLRYHSEEDSSDNPRIYWIILNCDFFF